MTGRVSVLMPVLNEAESIQRSIASVLAQTGVTVELLVVDGMSADATPALVQEMAARDPRVRLLRNPRTNIPAGLNVGLAHSSGSYIARVDGHSQISPSYLHTAIQAMAARPDMAGIGGKRIGVASTPVGRAVALALSSRFGVGNSVYHYATEAQLTDHASFGVYRAEVARAVGGWDESLPVNEDVDFDHKILAAGHVLGFDPTMEVSWQGRESMVDFARQYRRYGRGKAAMLRKNGLRAARIRHLVPPAAVVGVLAVGAVTPRHPRAALALVPYAAGVAVASAAAWRQRSHGVPTSAAALPAAFAAMHFSWGLGLVEGLLLGVRPALASGSATTSGSGAPGTGTDGPAPGPATVDAHA